MEIEAPEEPVPVREVPRSESIKENTHRQRNVRQHDTDFWNEIKDMPVTMSLRKILDLSPQAKTQLRAGISPKLPANTANTQENQEEPYSAAYLTVTIDGRPMTAVVDTGASVPIMTKDAVERLGYQIERPSSAVVVTANNEDVPVLGEIDDIAFRIGDATYSSTFMIIPDGDYDILLSFGLLQKMHAVIDTNNHTMRFTCKGKTYEVDLNCNRPTTTRHHQVNNVGCRLSEEEKQSIKRWQEFAENSEKSHSENLRPSPTTAPTPNADLTTKMEYVKKILETTSTDRRVQTETAYLVQGLQEILQMATNIDGLIKAYDIRDERIARTQKKATKVVQFSIPEWTAQHETNIVEEETTEEPDVPISWEERDEEGSERDQRTRRRCLPVKHLLGSLHPRAKNIIWMAALRPKAPPYQRYPHRPRPTQSTNLEP